MPKTRGDEGSEAFKARVGRHIASARARARLQGNELAAKIGVGPSTVTEWEKGRKLPSVENIMAIARVTEESVSFLLSDALPRSTSLEVRGREIASILGGRRLELLLAIPEQRLKRGVDALVGEYMAESDDPPAARASKK